MKAFNSTKCTELAASITIANSLPGRMKGLLGWNGLAAGEGLLIRPCCGIHTLGMKFSVDVLVLDDTGRVVATREKIPPNRMTRLYFRASHVLELPPGTIAGTGTRSGDHIDIG